MSGPVSIGAKRFRFDIQAKTTAQDAYGQDVESWPVVGNQQGSIKQLSGRMAVVAEQMKVTATHLIELRYVIPLAANTHRLALGSRIFNISSANNVEERNRNWELMVVEVKNPA